VVVAWDGDENLGELWSLGFKLEMEKDFVKVDFLVKMKKRNKNVKDLFK